MKYQVLSKHTNMVGIRKNKMKAQAPVERFQANVVSNKIMSQHANF